MTEPNAVLITLNYYMIVCIKLNVSSDAHYLLEKEHMNILILTKVTRTNGGDILLQATLLFLA